MPSGRRWSPTATKAGYAREVLQAWHEQGYAEPLLQGLWPFRADEEEHVRREHQNREARDVERARGADLRRSSKKMEGFS